MNDQVILSVAKKNGGLEVTTGGTGQDQLNAIRVAAAATFRVLHGARNLPEEMAAGVISAAALDGIQEAYTDTEGRRVRAIRYRADFTYHEGAQGVQVVEDVKSRATRTREYAMKKKLLKDRFGIDITEV